MRAGGTFDRLLSTAYGLLQRRTKRMEPVLIVREGRIVWDGPGSPPFAWDVAFEADGRRFSLSQGDLAAEMSELGAVTLHCRELALSWTLEPRLSVDGGRLLVESSIRNDSSKQISLGAFCPAVFPLLRFPTTEATLLPTPAGCAPRRVYRLGDPECPTTSRIMVQLWGGEAASALQIGFVSFHRAHTLVSHDSVTDGGIVGMTASFDFAGWALPPHSQTCGETFTIATSASPYEQLESWADEAAGSCSPRRWEDAPIGWL
jgi:hypothetical protein